MKDLKPKISKSLSIFFTILFVYLSIENFYLGIKNGETIKYIFIPIFLLFWAYNIFFQRRWALNLLVFTLFLFAILLIGVFSPFAASDYMFLKMEPPSITDILSWFIPVELLLLTMIYFINPSKKKA